MDKDIVLAFIGFAGLLVTAVSGYYTARMKRRLDVANAKVAMDECGFDFAYFFTHSHNLYDDIRALIEETEVTSWSLFKAWNGTHSPKWTTATLQIIADGLEKTPVTRFGLDYDWVSKLEFIKENSEVYLTTDDMPENSKARDVLVSDGDTGAVWASINYHQREKGKAMHTYSAFTTDCDGGVIEPTTLLRCRMIFDRLAGIAALEEMTE